MASITAHNGVSSACPSIAHVDLAPSLCIHHVPSSVFAVFFCLCSLAASRVKLLQTFSAVQFTTMTPFSRCTCLFHLVDSEHLQVKTV